jgi:hypothetical protein
MAMSSVRLQAHADIVEEGDDKLACANKDGSESRCAREYSGKNAPASAHHTITRPPVRTDADVEAHARGGYVTCCMDEFTWYTDCCLSG